MLYKVKKVTKGSVVNIALRSKIINLVLWGGVALKKVKHNKKTRKSYFIKILTLLVVFGTIIVYGNFTIGTTRYKITSNRLPVTFKEYKIAQISDLHNSEFGQGNSKIINILKKENPNIIVITGDLVDSSNTDIDIAIKFIQQAAKIAPC